MALNFGKGQRAIAFAPATAFPLDARSYFESYDLAVAAAAIAAEPGTLAAKNTEYYFGETLVVNEGGKATLYIIQPDKTLKEVGSVPVGDGKSIEVVNGQIKLKGFGSGYYQYNTNYVPGSTEEGKKDQYVFVEEGFKAGLQPQVVAKASGEGFEIAWYEPNPTTVEGLQSQITALDGSVNNLANKVDTKADASSLALYQTKAIPSIEGYASASTVEGALAEVMSQAMSNAGGITAVEGRVGKAEASINAMQPVLNAVSGTYATKEEVNALSTVYETIDNVSSKLANYYTSAQTDAKFETIANVGAKLSNYYTKEQADKKHEEVVKVAEGKTNTYILSYNETIETLKEKLKISDEQKVYDADGNDITAGIKNGDYDDYYIVNNIFNSNSEVVYGVVGYFITFNNLLMGHADEVYGSSYVILPLPHMAEKLKAGDILYITEVDVPDRWYAGGTSPAMFYKMETSKVDLEPYATTEYVDKAVGGINDSLASYATISYVDQKDGEIKEIIQTIEGDIQAIEVWAASSISVEDIEKWNKAEENAHNSAVASASAMVAEEAGVRESADNALSARIDAEVEARINGDKALSDRLDDEISARETLAERVETLEAQPFDTYATKSELDAEAKARSEADASLDNRLDAVEAQLGISDGGSNRSLTEQVEEIIKEVWGVSTIENFDFKASSEIDNLQEGFSGILNEIASIKTNYATENFVSEAIEAASHINTVNAVDSAYVTAVANEDKSVSIGVTDKLKSVIDNAATSILGGEYVSGSISGNNLTIDDSILANAMNGLNNKFLSIGTDYLVDISISTNTDDYGLRSASMVITHGNGNKDGINLTNEIFGTPNVAGAITSIVASSRVADNLYALGNTLHEGSVASDAGLLLSNLVAKGHPRELADGIIAAVDYIHTLDTTCHVGDVVNAVGWVSSNKDVVSNLATNAVTSVQTSTLVVSHVGNNLAINLPSVIWLDGGSASDTYEAEEAVYNELLNNEYGN